MKQTPTLPQLLKMLEADGRKLEAQAVKAILRAFKATDPEVAQLLRELSAALMLPNPAQRFAQRERLLRIASATIPDLPPPFLAALTDAVTLGGNVGAGMLAASGAPAALTIAAPAVEAAVATIPARLEAIWGDARADHAARVGRVMTQALQAGGRWPVRQQLQNALQVSRARAQLIATNETLHALAAGQNAVYDRVEEELELQINLTWRSASDRRVRSSHRALNGKTVKRGESFLPGVTLRWPHDPNCGDTSQVVRCRCTTLAAVAEESLTDAAREAPKITPPAPNFAAEAARVRAGLPGLPDRVAARLQERMDALQREYDDLQDTALKLSFNEDLSNEEREEGLERLYERMDRLRPQMDPLRGALNRRTGPMWEEAQAELSGVTVKDSRLKLDIREYGEFYALPGPPAEYDMDADLRLITRYVDRPLKGQVLKNTTTGRAYSAEDEVALDPFVSDPAIAVHEMGHWLEHVDEELRGQVRDFLAYRTRGRPLRTFDLPGMDEERYYAGAFDWAAAGPQMELFGQYAGRFYDSGLTEVMSVGLELMYRSPHVLAEVDPEFFDFIYTVSRGGTWNKPKS